MKSLRYTDPENLFIFEKYFLSIVPSNREWYDTIVDSYESLYGLEQLRKIEVIKDIYEKLFGNIRFKRGLDVGCGTGISTQFLSQIAEEVYACDVSPKMIEKAKERVPNAKFIVCDASEMPYQNQFFDIVTCVTVLQDNKDPEGILREIKRVSKDNAIIILSVLKKKGIAYWKPLIKKYFNILWFHEEEKDYIFFLSNRRF